MNQTAEVRSPSDYAHAAELARRVVEKSPGLQAEVIRSPGGVAPAFASIVFSTDYGSYVIDWRIHRRVVELALQVAGLKERFKPLA